MGVWAVAHTSFCLKVINLNDKNLINPKDRTPEERRRIAQLGGIASAKKRKYEATLKKKFLLMQVDYETIQQLSKIELELFREWQKERHKNYLKVVEKNGK